MIVPASADEDSYIVLHFQSLELTPADYIIFDDIGADIIHANTTSTITLDYNESTFYTLQMQPSATNVDPGVWYENIFSLIVKNYIAVFLIIVLVLVATKKK